MSTLTEILRKRIEAEGPIPVAHYMAEALGHPEHGYYRRKDPLGAAGDFTTSPEISQVFGEILGLWCAVVWQGMGAPGAIRLVELGPGRGTLMADALRALKVLPPFIEAASIHLVETSPVLREKQAEALKGFDVSWHDSFDQVPGGPVLLLANEFFDALPVHQFLKTRDGWSERLVDLDPDGDGLRLVNAMPLAMVPQVPEDLLEVADGSVVEVCPAASAIAYALGERLATQGGAALVIDYGHPRSAVGDTLQAVREHKFTDVLADPGEADLTAHVDFEALARAAIDGGASAWGPVTQAELLGKLGIVPRAEALMAGASEDQRGDIESAVRRLVEEDQMGTLFKAVALTHPEMGPPPAFE